jgi:long-chain acyl-CoA synthetase
MPKDSLLEYFQPASRPPGEIAVAWRIGYRMVRWSHADLLRTSAQFARELEARDIAKGDRVLLWGENSGLWIAAFIGCLLRGAVAVPMDAIADKSFALRVAQQAGARLAVVGRNLDLTGFSAPIMDLEELPESVGARPAGPYPSPKSERSDPIEIVFTSGTTSEPRGVVLTHGNILANLEPLEREIARYRRAERIFHPLRFLDLLPLSHVFGQLLGIFVPQILGATSIFLDTLNPNEIIHAIRTERVSVLVTVPRLIESLQNQIERDLAASGDIENFKRVFQAADGKHFLRRWWRFRKIHRRFGWKFWAMISGGAALPSNSERFWDRLGYAVIQGYGLTETTSLVSVNHPFRLGRGSIGKTVPGLEMKLSDDGEILVRGENVAAGYWKDARLLPVLDSEGWFHTGDLGERDANGTLYFKGRLKNVIVTPEGLNIYPEDLEAELRKELGVRDCVVIGVDRDGNAVPCAVLLLRDSSEEAAALVRHANERLAPFQQIRHWIVWPEKEFPRTSTQKPILARIREVVQADLSGERTKSRAATTHSGPLAEILSRISPGPTMQAGEATGLPTSSIDRVELLSALEDRYQVDLSESDFAAADTVAAIEKLLDQPQAHSVKYRYPRWAQTWPVRWLRAAAFYLLQRPAMLLLAWPRVRGRDNLRGVDGPLLVISNHVTYLDPAYILAALPRRFRVRLAVAMEGERLAAMRNPPAGTGFLLTAIDRIRYFLTVALFNVFPLPRRSGFRKSFAYAGELADRGWSVLVFPEGELTIDGGIAPFRAGIGLLATRLNLPVLPIRIDGLFELRQARKRLAGPGRVRVKIGAPVVFKMSLAPEEIARELERRVIALGAE